MAKFCRNCGAEIGENAFVCLKCGAKVDGGQTVSNPNAKSKLTAGLLGIFLGSFGVHNFYLGFKGKAVGQLLITLLSCFFLSPVSGIWGFIEGIMILTGSSKVDAEGNLLGE